jgi:hypothetical protein
MTWCLVKLRDFTFLYFILIHIQVFTYKVGRLQNVRIAHLRIVSDTRNKDENNIFGF